jgi:hypothetical protein
MGGAPPQDDLPAVASLAGPSNDVRQLPSVEALLGESARPFGEFMTHGQAIRVSGTVQRNSTEQLPHRCAGTHAFYETTKDHKRFTIVVIELRSVCSTPTRTSLDRAKDQRDCAAMPDGRRIFTRAELERRYSEGERDFRRVELRDNSNPTGTKRSGANPLGINLAGANLSGADLGGGRLMGANLTDATLCEANLREAELDGAKMGHTKLSDANLSRASHSHVILGYADLGQADLTAVLTEALGTVPEPGHGFTESAHPAKLTPTRANK